MKILRMKLLKDFSSPQQLIRHYLNTHNMRFFERFFTPHTGNPKSVYSLDKTEIMCFHHARYAVDCWISRDFLDFFEENLFT